MRNLAFLLLCSTAHAASYRQVIERVASMVDDAHAQELAQRRRLEILNLTWEDTGRWTGSSVGPNISDVTIEVQDGKRTTLMPVLRFPNFSDVTGDVSI